MPKEGQIHRYHVGTDLIMSFEGNTALCFSSHINLQQLYTSPFEVPLVAQTVKNLLAMGDTPV